MLPRPPFLLLDDARPGGRRLLYRDPVEIVTAIHPAKVRPALDRLRALIQAGHHVAGYLTYEAGFALDDRLAPLARDGAPLLWFGAFPAPEALAADLSWPDPAGACAGAPEPLVSREDHEAAVAEIQRLIAAGDIYQANLSFPARLPVAGHPAALYARLRPAAGAGWGALVATGARWLLSFSPEMFFTLEGERLAARPMKGTSRRGDDAAEDDALAAALAADPKQRAENLMIVDLMRNDLSRVAKAGSVRVPELFAVERYPTVLQMVSQIEAELAPACDAIDVLAALFPCGSITGAPKLRAMEAIATVEPGPRHAYTGAIGAVAPDGDAAFNVAIRTIEWEEGANDARLGLGSAIVADSTASSEWAECLQKAAFVNAGLPTFDLIETLRFDPDEGLPDLDRHMARLKESATALGFAVDRHAIRNDLHAATFRRTVESKIRLRLSRSGAVAIEVSAAPPAPSGEVGVALRPLPVDPADVRLRHKTSDRAFYEEARIAAARFEVAFVHPSGGITEGSFTNIFVAAADGRLRTPPISLGLLPGVLRARLIEEGRAYEDALHEADLADGFFVGNALRGLIPARLS
ncbi:aminodeoxychorismate synthase component I [Sphingomonas sp. BIUV-7]|uniref:Probable branched-chain-amino-acid aminotransferase n=1 Tax=Sphingomonas natans TaxID=3063330 RepID=A0ABT8YD53_9SPHN|nr:aminodeoxychorismate synthase component I [Sphingomonas sp. BIUV-7]MDO6415872.1 aminodeoxychorismate synthase component I [Sphingomonas sp. BIUV-7]